MYGAPTGPRGRLAPGASAAAALVLAFGLLFAACSTTTRYEILSFFFDGVPPPDHRVAHPAQEAAPRVPTSQLPFDLGAPMHVHRPYSEGKCDKCHATRTGKQEGIGAIFQGLPMLRLPIEQLCFKCHAIERKPFLHAPAVAGQCLFCHDPHQTQHRRMLLAKSTRDLCARCHRGPTFLTELVHAEYGERECIECHDPHAADFAFNLLPGVEQGKPQPRQPTVSLPKEW